MRTKHQPFFSHRIGIKARRVGALLLVPLMMCLALPAVTASASPPVFNDVTFYQNDSVTGAGIDQEENSPTALTSLASLGSTFVNPGYIFVEWSETANNAAGSPVFSDGQSFDFNSNISLYAQWAAIPTDAISFSANGATGSVASIAGVVGSSLTLPTGTSLSWAGHSFTGWNSAAGGEGIAYAAGGLITVATSLSLYAQWVPIPTDTISFSANGATGSVASIAGVVGSSLTLPTGTSLSWAGHSFTGWNSAAGGEGIAYAAGGLITVATSLSLYAQWSETNYVVNFNSDGGAVSPTQSSFNIGNGSVVLPTPTYSGFVFSGWYSAASGGALVGVAGSLIAFSASTDLYAQWVAVVVPPIQALESTVNFGANGGVGSVTALTGVNGTSVTLPGGIGMSYAGKTFANWNTTANGSGTAYNVDVPLKLNSSVTLYAQWDTLLAFKSPAVLLGAVGRFSSGSSSLSSALKIQVRQLASLVKAGGYVLVTLYGYSSDSGTAAHKISISKSRANAVAGFLRARFVTLHVKGVSIKTAGEGAIKGKVSAAYRRVEVFVTA